MTKFHYEYIKPKYGDRAELLFTDTDSLCYHIQTKDFHKDITPDVYDKFDTSNYSPNHSSGIPTGINKRELGYMKDEACGNVVTEFVGLRCKLYAYKVLDRTTGKKCKGVKKPFIKKCLNFDQYQDCLFHNKKYMTKFNTLRSRKHEETIETVSKVALSSNDDKRYIVKGSHKTLPFGHWTLKVPSLIELHLNEKKLVSKKFSCKFCFEKNFGKIIFVTTLYT